MHGQTCGANAISGGGMVKCPKGWSKFGKQMKEELPVLIKPNRHERRKAKSRKTK